MNGARAAHVLGEEHALDTAKTPEPVEQLGTQGAIVEDLCGHASDYVCAHLWVGVDPVEDCGLGKLIDDDARKADCEGLRALFVWKRSSKNAVLGTQVPNR
jgi:hypothetical protein